MSTENKDDTVEKNSRVAKNLNISEVHAEWLEDMAEEWYGSSYKQGRVVEELIDAYTGDESGELISLVKEIHSVTVERESGEISSHTQVSNQFGDSELQEISDKAGVEDLNPNDYDLRKVKGRSDVDQAEVAYSVLLHTHGSDLIVKSDVREMSEEEMGYAYSGANNIASRTLKRCVSLPNLNDDMNRLTNAISKNETEHNPQRLPFTQNQLERMSSVEEWVKEDLGLNATVDGYAVTTDTAEQLIEDDFFALESRIEEAKYKGDKKRIYEVLKVYVDAVESRDDLEMTTLMEKAVERSNSSI